VRRLGTAILIVLLLAAALATPSARRAHAEIEGPCTATVNGIEVGPLSSSDSGDAIKVKKDDTITVVMTSATGFESHKIDMEIAGFRINLQEKPDGGDPEWSGSADVSDYADYGVGLYKVVGEGKLVDGTVCTGAVLIEVDGSALTSIVGLIALGLFAFGLLLLGGSLLGAVNRYGAMRKRVEAWSQEQARLIASGASVPAGDLVASLRNIARPQAPITLWTLAMLPLFVLIGAIPAGGAMPSGGSGPSLGPIKLPRLPARPSTSAVGSVGGMMATEAIVVLFQQFAISPLTQSNAIIGIIAGLALAVVFTTIVKLIGGRGVNKSIAQAEARFNDAIAQVRREAGLPPAAPGTPGGPPIDPPPPQPAEGDRAGGP